MKLTIPRQIKAVAAVILLTGLVAGCSMLASKPPSALETKLYDIKTNQVPVVVLRTNVVTVTETNVVTVRNPVTQVIYQTNQVTVQIVGTNIVTVTNLVPAYDFTPKASAVADAQITGGVINTVFPGWGSVVSYGLTGLLALWGGLRTKKQNANTANLTQAIETARSVIKSLPNGATIGTQFDNFLVQHQTDANLLDEIGTIVDSTVNPDAAQGAATKIIQLVTTPLNPTPPVAAAPSNG